MIGFLVFALIFGGACYFMYRQFKSDPPVG